MKFNRLDDNKLQIIMNKDDLRKRNIAKWDLLPYNPQAQKVFQDILDEAYEECGFEVDNNAQLMIEALPLTAESILITVTKVESGFREDLERELSHLSSKLLADLRQRMKSKLPRISFTNLMIWRKLSSWCRRLARIWRVRFTAITANIICICRKSPRIVQHTVI